jgi:hypothetical protein
VQEFADEVLIYDLNKNQAFCLNQTSAIIWQACDGKNSISQINQIIKRKLNSSVSEDFVLFALEELKKQHLIENDLPQFFAGLTRREVVKKIGITTMLALPIVTSFVAPTAANAASVSCTDCARMNDSCSPGCETALGTCYDNSGCGGGQSISNVTCSQCKAGVVFAGGVSTGSWEGN